MNFYTYIDSTPEEFAVYLDNRLVQKNEHPVFPLNLYCYGRKAVYDNVWDKVTTRCRGVIVHRETGEIVARPFEKFFNYGSLNPATFENYAENYVDNNCQMYGQPVVWEKLDGFMCTGYFWEGKWYVASKGSFTSPHAKWATAWLQSKNLPSTGHVTPVFEGLTPNLRIVVDYGKREGLVLTALIQINTGEELPPELLQSFAYTYGLTCAKEFDMTWEEAAKASLDDQVKNEEGFVLTWYRSGTIPFRLKVKYQDYLRLHRLVTNVGPKRILETLMNGWNTEVEGMMTNSTPWFAAYFNKWKTVIETEYALIFAKSADAYSRCLKASMVHDVFSNLGAFRKDFAAEVSKPENKPYSGLCFALLDGKETAPIIWKMIKNSDLLKNGGPMIDEHLI